MRHKFGIKFALFLLAFAVWALARACERPVDDQGVDILTGEWRSLYCVKPSSVVLSATGEGKATLYNGLWYQRKAPSPDLYEVSDEEIRIKLGGYLSAAPRSMNQGTLPLISGARAFYFEAETLLNSDDMDHWPAIWLMPIEHNQWQDDVFNSDMTGYERWLEIDVDEGGFTEGAMGTAIAWEGVWPNYRKTRSPYKSDSPRIDTRKVSHKFAVLFDPRKGEIRWFLDGILYQTWRSEIIKSYAERLNFYPIFDAESHGARKPYTMKIRHFAAWVQ